MRSCKLAAEVSGILSQSLLSIIQLCDKQSFPLDTIIDKEWITNYLKTYNKLYQIETKKLEKPHYIPKL